MIGALPESSEDRYVVRNTSLYCLPLEYFHLILVVILLPGISAQHSRGNNRIQPTTVATNTTALPEVKLEESVRQCPAAPPCPPSSPCPALPPCPAIPLCQTYNRTEHDLEDRKDRGAKHGNSGDGKCPPPSVKTYSKVAGMEFGAKTSCDGTSPEFFTLGPGSTGMLCFRAIALGYLQYLDKKYRSAPADSTVSSRTAFSLSIREPPSPT
ncbi:hypothetical protein RvY_06435 [Ramazzottius varieornatus]|uniref:Uncharacterized protein n=1 Tax=Ramazzottius varieornatus TaxID=947166 RepID=A0A1D1V1J4_RAMVA|nr:hypothetical protein RvY_06435 [Ramazzottius varieornatus]